eukprot:3536776-Pyramimonas_sp.AAC.4
MANSMLMPRAMLLAQSPGTVSAKSRAAILDCDNVGRHMRACGQANVGPRSRGPSRAKDWGKPPGLGVIRTRARDMSSLDRRSIRGFPCNMVYYTYDACSSCALRMAIRYQSSPLVQLLVSSRWSIYTCSPKFGKVYPTVRQCRGYLMCKANRIVYFQESSDDVASRLAKAEAEAAELRKMLAAVQHGSSSINGLRKLRKSVQEDQSGRTPFIQSFYLFPFDVFVMMVHSGTLCGGACEGEARDCKQACRWHRIQGDHMVCAEGSGRGRQECQE